MVETRNSRCQGSCLLVFKVWFWFWFRLRVREVDGEGPLLSAKSTLIVSDVGRQGFKGIWHKLRVVSLCPFAVALDRN